MYGGPIRASGEPSSASPWNEAGAPGAGPRVRSALDCSLDARKVAHHEEQVHQPQRDPCGCDQKKPDGEEDQAGRKEQQDATEQPGAIASARVPGAFDIVDPA